MHARVGTCIFSLFSLVLLDWLGFTLKVADHLRQIAWSNRLNEKQPASTSTTQNVDCVNETLVYCTDILYPLAMTWKISKKAKKKKKRKRKSTYDPPNKYLSLNRTGSPLKVDNKRFGSRDWQCALKDFLPLFLLSALSYSPLRKGNLTLVSVTNLVRQDFSHTLHKRLTPYKVLISNLRQGWVNCSQETALKT